MPGPFLTTIARAWDMDVFAERAQHVPAAAGRRGRRDRRAPRCISPATPRRYTTGTILTVDGGAQWSMAGTGDAAPGPQLEVNSSHGTSPVMPAQQPLWLRAVLPARAGRRRAGRGGGPLGDLLRSGQHDTRVTTQGGGAGRGRLAALPAPAQPAGRHRTSAACASSWRGWSGGSTSCRTTSQSSMNRSRGRG